MIATKKLGSSFLVGKLKESLLLKTRSFFSAFTSSI